MNQCGDMKHDNPLDPENKDTKGKVTIWIEHPYDGDSVTMVYLITGSVHPRAEIRVLLRALTTNEYWVQDVPVVDNYGKWQTVCWFGTETVGMGEYYEVFAITPKVKLLPEDVLPSLPDYTNMSNRVTVYRPE
jgi:hypothetical protein